MTNRMFNWLAGTIAAIAFAALVIMVAAPAFAQGPTTEQINSWLMSPTVLYVLMILGSLVSMLKQWKVSQMDGGTATFGSLFTHLQELLTTLFGNTILFAGLIQTDTLNFVSAVTIGYAVSSLSDLNPAGSRSTALLKKGE